MTWKITFLPNGKSVPAKRGETVLQAALRNRIPLRNHCGGKGTCTTCKIRLESEQPLVSLPTRQEIRMLGEERLAQQIRLACQTRVYGPLEVSIPEEAWKATVRKQFQQQMDEGRTE